jgi:hypothetical protein
MTMEPKIFDDDAPHVKFVDEEGELTRLDLGPSAGCQSEPATGLFRVWDDTWTRWIPGPQVKFVQIRNARPHP